MVVTSKILWYSQHEKDIQLGSCSIPVMDPTCYFRHPLFHELSVEVDRAATKDGFPARNPLFQVFKHFSPYKFQCMGRVFACPQQTRLRYIQSVRTSISERSRRFSPDDAYPLLRGSGYAILESKSRSGTACTHFCSVASSVLITN